MDNLFCKGFKAGGVAAGLKKAGEKDLGLIYSEVPANVAGLFTKNRVKAAPVLLDMERIKSGRCRAVIANSGNANCCTGDRGMLDALSMAETAAAELSVEKEQVLVASTGVIGEPLPVAKIKENIPRLVGSMKPEGIEDFAKAVMTTDTIPKVITKRGELGGKTYVVTGVAKGAGMIKPDMATMLSFLYTDADVSPGVLGETIAMSSERSFNRITIDGDTSTNDTVLIMANGMSGVVVETSEAKVSFQKVIDELTIGLARMLVKDGEGVTKLVEIFVKGAHGDSDARKVADSVSNSNLVKTAFFGEDANWGRIMMAAGNSGVEFDQNKIDIRFDEILMVKAGLGQGPGAEAEATQILKKDEFTITIDLNAGNAACSMFTCDFSLDYVKINADYRS